MKTQVRIRCQVCGGYSSVLVDEADLSAWQEGMHAQDAFPYLSPVQRELMISQTCGACWDVLFPDED